MRGDSPLRAGLSLLPATLVMAAAAPVAGQLTARRGPAHPAGRQRPVHRGRPGAAARPRARPRPTCYLAVALAVLGAGLGLVNPPITGTAVSGMPPAQAGVASAVVSVTRQVGSLLGVAVMGDLVTTGVSRGLAAGQTHAAALSAATHAPWALGVACGLLVALAGYLTTTARAHATAAAIAAADGGGTGHAPVRADRGGRRARRRRPLSSAGQLGQQPRLLGRVEAFLLGPAAAPGPRRGCRGSSR